ncbi:MAG: hypothetical protein COB30_020565 [Ectothiorhodospiraceae bacterium]|nr:hypothetical protein [Ectothiorhodospiraceae bacterium]
MHRRLIIFTIVLLSGALPGIFLAGNVSAELYKRVNPDGSVEFTDIPANSDDEPLKLAPLSTFKSTLPPREGIKIPSTSASVKYTSAKIISPANETTIRDNAGIITVNASVSPGLQSGHKIVLLDNGVIKGESTSGSFTISNADRGAHALSIQVQNKSGKTLISSGSVTVYLHRRSVFNP